jgi:ABC-type nitrate/sulfonate/bicarbonate transport system ATPase subunit
MIECTGLSMKYGKQEIFKNFNHTFKDNSITAIMGESGKGKTTLIKCIAGLNKAYEGQILYKKSKEDAAGDTITKPHKDIFMMHQSYTNFPWKNCLENVLFPLEINGKISEADILEAKEILASVNLNGYEDKHPSELSGGMNQRLAMARMLMAKPRVLLMDEPMSALDSVTRGKVQDLLMNFQRKLKNTIILITHDESEAKRISSEIINF